MSQENPVNPLIVTFVTLVDYKVSAVQDFIQTMNETGLVFASEAPSLGKLKGVEHRTIQIEYETQNAVFVGQLVEAMMKVSSSSEETCFVCGGGDEEEFGVDTYVCPACRQQALLEIRAQRASK